MLLHLSSLACLPLSLEYKETMYYKFSISNINKHYTVLFKNCDSANVCIPNIIQMMLVSFIPDVIFPGSSPVIWSTSVGVDIFGKTSQSSSSCHQTVVFHFSTQDFAVSLNFER